MKRSIGCKQLLLGLTVALALTGCANANTNGKRNADVPENASGAGNASGSVGTTDPGSANSSNSGGSPEAKQLKVKTYFANDNLDKLIEREAEITYSTDADKYKASLNALKQPPEDKLSSLSEGITYKSVEVKDGNVVVDLSIADEGRLGAPGEQLLVLSIRESLFQFSEVKSIELLVDGKKTESLMGHVSLPHPIKRD